MIIMEGVVDGKYYENGTLKKSVGLVKVEDAYYYVTDSGKVYVGKIYVSEAKANGLKPAQSN